MAREPFIVTTLWMGGFFFWLTRGCRSKLMDETDESRNNRNLIAGYVIQLFFLGLVVYVIYIRKL